MFASTVYARDVAFLLYVYNMILWELYNELLMIFRSRICLLLKFIKFLTASFYANHAWFEFLRMCFSRYAKYGNAWWEGRDDLCFLVLPLL